MPLCVLVKANERQRHVFALFLHNPVLSKPSYFLQKPTKTKTFCTKFPTTQSSRYTLDLTQPKMGTLADWLQPDPHSVSTLDFLCFLLLLSEGLLKDAGQRFCKAVASWLEWEVILPKECKKEASFDFAASSHFIFSLKFYRFLFSGTSATAAKCRLFSDLALFDLKYFYSESK